MVKKSRLFLISLVILAGLGFLLRIWGLWQKSSFWVDEASSAGFARAILIRGKPVLATGYFPDNYLLHFYLMAASFKTLGLTEFAARFPSVIFGSLTILITCLLGEKLANRRVGLLAAILVTFSVWEITMSRQARSYQMLQFFYLASLLFFYQVLNWFGQQALKWWHFGVLASLVVCAILTHMLGLTLLVTFALYIVFIRPDLLQAFSRQATKLLPSTAIRLAFLVLGGGAVIIVLEYLNFFRGVKEVIWNTYEGKFVLFNHIKYYHSLFWRQYGLFSFLAFLGIIWLALKEFKKAILLGIALTVHLGLIFFRAPEAYTRYPFIIFPLILILFSFALWQIWEWFFNSLGQKGTTWVKVQQLSFLSLGLFIVLNGYKFTFRPKSFYSVNSEMREVPEPDFKAAYQYLLLKDPQKKFILVDTRPDASLWYLGEGYPQYYLGGQEKAVLLRLSKGFATDEVSGASYLTSTDSLRQVVDQNERGFVVLELPTVEYAQIDPSIIDYITDHLGREKRFDRIPGNENGDWPIEVYSWGY